MRIDPITGNVLQWIDLTALVPPVDVGSAMNVLNGIAWNPATGDLLVTGNLWPKLFEIRVRPLRVAQPARLSGVAAQTRRRGSP